MEKEAYLFAIYEILQSETDENNPLSAVRIIEILEDRYSIKIGIKKFYKAIRVLSGLFKISPYTENRKGYYLISRQFSKAEVLHLCHAVHSTNSMTPTQIRNLEDKLLTCLSSCERQEFRESVYLMNPKNAGNEEWLSNMDQISEAIYRNQWIRFDYVHYDINKNLVSRKEPYFREPRFIAFDNMHSYLITTDDHHKEPTHFRIDKLRNLKILKKDIDTTFSIEDAYEYAASKIFMFAGENIQAKFKCRITQNVFDIMIDEFGMDARFIPIKDDPQHFILSVRASFQGLIIFSQKYSDIITPVFPEKLVDYFKAD